MLLIESAQRAHNFELSKSVGRARESLFHYPDLNQIHAYLLSIQMKSANTAKFSNNNKSSVHTSFDLILLVATAGIVTLWLNDPVIIIQVVIMYVLMRNAH